MSATKRVEKKAIDLLSEIVALSGELVKNVLYDAAGIDKAETPTTVASPSDNTTGGASDTLPTELPTPTAQTPSTRMVGKEVEQPEAVPPSSPPSDSPGNNSMETQTVY